MENHILRLCCSKDYICRVLEEILIYDKSNNGKLVLNITIVERAYNNLTQLLKYWRP